MSDGLTHGAYTASVDTASQIITLYHDDVQHGVEVLFIEVIALFPTTSELGTSQEKRYTLLRVSKTGVGDNDSNGKEKYMTTESLKVVDPPEVLLDHFLISRLPEYLSVPSSENDECNLHVIVSIKSGICEAEMFFENVVQVAFHALGLSGQHYQVHKTSSEHSIKEFVCNILGPRAGSGIAQTALLLSGDGGIVDIINVLQSFRRPDFLQPTVGLLAMGTGNALANSAGLNGDFTRGLRSFLRGHPQNLPTFAASFSQNSQHLVDEGRRTEPLNTKENPDGIVHGAVVCSWALHASLVADSDTTEYRKFGPQRFQMAAKELLDPSDGSEPHLYSGRVTLYKKNENGQEYTEHLDRTKHMYVLATLVSNLEEKLSISPNSKPLDGQLRLVHFGAHPSDEVMRILGLAFQGGKHVLEASVGYDSIEGMRIELDEEDSHWRRICIDGKIIQVGKGGWVVIRKEMYGVVNLVVDDYS
ncbi:hypothetical protein MMC26_007586 [Xylographa opegraphella]|nr:hypothetical protein [Xylographa opegraphella]